MNILQVDDFLLRIVQARRSVRNLIDGQPWYIWRLCTNLVPQRMLDRIIYVLIVFVTLRHGCGILIYASIVKGLAICLHLPLGLHDFVSRDLQTKVRL